MNGQVVVTGFGAITPVGNDRETTWQALVKGVSGIDTITAFDPSGLPTRIAGEVKGFDPAALLDTKPRCWTPKGCGARPASASWPSPPPARRSRTPA